jgi:hypothetical protein
MPHLTGCGFRTSPQAERAVAVRASFRTHDGWVLVRRHEGADWLPHSPTQADADVATATMSSAEMMEERRTRSTLRRAEARKVTRVGTLTVNRHPTTRDVTDAACPKTTWHYLTGLSHVAASRLESGLNRLGYALLASLRRTAEAAVATWSSLQPCVSGTGECLVRLLF